MGYQEDDLKQYMQLLHEYVIGHLCYECRRRITVNQVVTIQLIGPMPVYHHSACFYTEDELQAMIEKKEGKND